MSKDPLKPEPFKAAAAPPEPPKPAAAPAAALAAAPPAKATHTTERTTFLIVKQCYRDGVMYQPGDTITVPAGAPISSAFGPLPQAAAPAAPAKPTGRVSDKDVA